MNGNELCPSSTAARALFVSVWSLTPAEDHSPRPRRFNRMETNEAECYAAINVTYDPLVYHDASRETRTAFKLFIIITSWISIVLALKFYGM